MKIRDLAGRVLRGYARALRSLGEVLAVFAGMAGIAFVVVFPLWWLAVNRRQLYTALVAGAGLVAAGILVLRRFRSRHRSGPGTARGGPRIALVLAPGLLAAGIYGIGVLFFRSPALGILAALALLAAAGVWAFGRDGRTNRER
jgi:hypothetical protein